MTYLERAEKWVDNMDGVDIDTVESTIERFSYEMSKCSAGSEKHVDLKATIGYVKETLLSLGLSEDETPNKRDISNEIYVFDTSSLGDSEVGDLVVLSETEKADALAELSSLPAFKKLKTTLDAKVYINGSKKRINS